MKSIAESSLSLRSRASLRAASLLLVASSATGCVAAKDYNEARSVAESEQQGHARTRERLEAAMARIATLEADLTAREQAMEKTESAVEESKLASTVALKEKDAAQQLVETLRAELARTGDHLVLFANEKRDLAQTLLLAEERMRDIEASGKNLGELVAATRDLSLSLASELDSGGVTLGARDGQVVVGVAPERLFTANGDSLMTEAGPVLAAVGKTSQKHPGLRVIVREPAAAGLGSMRMARLSESLRQNGVVEGRLVLPVVAAAGAEPASGNAAPSGGEAANGNSGSVPAGAVKPAGAVPAVRADGAASRYEIAFAP
jgi:hypothetical protein